MFKRKQKASQPIKQPQPEAVQAPAVKAQLWHKIKHHAGQIGHKGLVLVLKLYYAAQDSDTPAWAKATIYTAIAYFILPLDGIPDFLLGGYTDDIGTLTAALVTVASHVKPEHQDQAEAKLAQWQEKSAN